MIMHGQEHVKMLIQLVAAGYELLRHLVNINPHSLMYWIIFESLDVYNSNSNENGYKT